jgi:hypothetical protein
MTIVLIAAVARNGTAGWLAESGREADRIKIDTRQSMD